MLFFLYFSLEHPVLIQNASNDVITNQELIQNVIFNRLKTGRDGLQRFSSLAPSPTQPNDKKYIDDLSQPFAANEGLTMTLGFDTSNLMASFASTEIFQDLQFHTKSNHQEPLHEKESFHTRKRRCEAPKDPIPSYLSYQHMHPFSSISLVTFKKEVMHFARHFQLFWH